ncbi:helix-turn-helix domain-containing protein [Escherichia coli]|uniref:helix-turn-helix domain-containing protein n=1 Tax=Escherichia coli TaxID=562 RepID=UPI000BB5BB95|nr:helix-turn-helix domain-containing protein [Escherichia coli]EHL9819618.1 helix-turn-helix domain-containing protein [Salmonella enterica subsp. enterica serovar Hartford]EEQ7975769.1 transcriptional regulator [Escherichia coli]EET8027888.1 transcriptional regulator [Escherichia coli]EEV1307668.1 transcriptional regulator [Escherichia coli]EEV6657597.1 transcriptional regulator [Escherichia coli]
MSTNKAEKKALMDCHRADIVAGLHKNGTSLRKLSLSLGKSPGYLKNALDRPWPKGERIIADALGMSPEDIWPSRYR